METRPCGTRLVTKMFLRPDVTDGNHICLGACHRVCMYVFALKRARNSQCFLNFDSRLVREVLHPCAFFAVHHTWSPDLISFRSKLQVMLLTVSDR